MAYEATKKVSPEEIFNKIFAPNLKAYQELQSTVNLGLTWISC